MAIPKRIADIAKLNMLIVENTFILISKLDHVFVFPHSRLFSEVVDVMEMLSIREVLG
jgi:hypothetical protein